MLKFIEPSIKETAFNCAHCGALAAQAWYRALALSLDKKTPELTTVKEAEDFHIDGMSDEQTENIRRHLRLLAAGEVFLGASNDAVYTRNYVSNVSFSRCFNCERTTLWVGDRPVWPYAVRGIAPSEDMPSEVRADFEEAAAIVDASPRGAAALLRLAVQKLCAFLGGSGKNINEDIAAMVAKGLDVRVQRALDVVRVVGNNAVHPGEIDLRDNRDTASQLFGLVNIIVGAMITQPAEIEKLYGALPPGALAAIERRDGAT